MQLLYVYVCTLLTPGINMKKWSLTLFMPPQYTLQYTLPEKPTGMRTLVCYNNTIG